MKRERLILVGHEVDGYQYTMLDYAPGDDDLIDDDPQPLLEDLADWLDAKAEGRNNHPFVDAHRALAVILHSAFGREQATAIMREITAFGGLDGACVQARRDFGNRWNDWSLPG